MKWFLIYFGILASVQSQQGLLLGKWKLITKKDQPATEDIQIAFETDNTFTLSISGRAKPGRWHLIPERKILIFTKPDGSDSDEMVNFRVTFDSLFITEANNNMVFLRMK